MDTEVQEEGPVRGDAKGGRGDTEGACGAHGRRRDGGGVRLPRPHPHMPEDRPQAERRRRRREAEGQELDNPAREAPGMATGRGQGPDSAGQGPLREHRRPERVGDQEVHPEPGGRQPDRVGDGEPPIGGVT